MSKIVLVACSKTKLTHPAPAWRLYQGQLFKKSLAYAQTLGADHIYILSAKYGLVRLSDIVRPYDQTLCGEPISERRLWAAQIAGCLEYLHGTHVPGGGIWPPMGGAHFVMLAGRRYRDVLTPRIEAAQSTWEAPMEGLGIGQQLAWLTKQLEK